MSSNKQNGNDIPDAEMTNQDLWSQEAVVASPATPPNDSQTPLEDVNDINVENNGGPSAQVSDSQNPEDDESEEEGEFYAMTLRSDGTLVRHDNGNAFPSPETMLLAERIQALLLAGPPACNMNIGGPPSSFSQPADPAHPGPKRMPKSRASKKKDKKKKKQQG